MEYNALAWLIFNEYLRKFCHQDSHEEIHSSKSLMAPLHETVNHPNNFSSLQNCRLRQDFTSDNAVETEI